jgi:glycosyltransferase involved in cell wall biosynthesis
VKVCFVTANYPPEALGGTEQVVSALARELRRLGVEPFVISGSDQWEAISAPDVATEDHEGIEVFRLRQRPGDHNAHGFVRERVLAPIRRLLAERRPEVVHVHSFSRLGTGITSLCRELGARTVVSFHDLWVTCARYFRVPAAGITCPTGIDRGPCAPCIQDWYRVDRGVIEVGLRQRDELLRAEMALAHVAIAPSKTAAAFVRECLPYERPIEVVPHGLIRPVPAADLAPRRQPGEPLRIGMFGGLVGVKGVRELVAAVAGLPCELHLSGPFHDQELEQEVRAATAANGTRLVLRSRYTADDRHPARDLHLAVFPSKCQETYGLVVDEALAHGVPVVCSDAGALRERAGTGGVVVTPIAQLADVLRELVASPTRLAELRAAIPTSLPTIAASAQRHLELYRRLR